MSTSLFSLLKLLTGQLYIRASLVSSVDKESAYSAGDLGSIPGLGRYPGEGNGHPLQYSCLENLMDRGAWQTVHGLARVRHDLVIKPPPSQAVYILIYYWHDIFQAVL